MILKNKKMFKNLGPLFQKLRGTNKNELFSEKTFNLLKNQTRNILYHDLNMQENVNTQNEMNTQNELHTQNQLSIENKVGLVDPKKLIENFVNMVKNFSYLKSINYFWNSNLIYHISNMKLNIIKICKEYLLKPLFYGFMRPLEKFEHLFNNYRIFRLIMIFGLAKRLIGLTLAARKEFKRFCDLDKISIGILDDDAAPKTSKVLQSSVFFPLYELLIKLAHGTTRVIDHLIYKPSFKALDQAVEKFIDRYGVRIKKRDGSIEIMIEYSHFYIELVYCLVFFGTLLLMASLFLTPSFKKGLKKEILDIFEALGFAKKKIIEALGFVKTKPNFLERQRLKDIEFWNKQAEYAKTMLKKAKDYNNYYKTNPSLESEKDIEHIAGLLRSAEKKRPQFIKVKTPKFTNIPSPTEIANKIDLKERNVYVRPIPPVSDPLPELLKTFKENEERAQLFNKYISDMKKDIDLGGKVTPDGRPVRSNKLADALAEQIRLLKEVDKSYIDALYKIFRPDQNKPSIVPPSLRKRESILKPIVPTETDTITTTPDKAFEKNVLKPLKPFPRMPFHH